MPTVNLGPAEATPYTIAVVSSTAATISVVPAVTGQVVKVYRFYLVSSGTAIVTPQDGTTALSGGVPLVANGSWVLAADGIPWFVTSPGNAFQLANSGTGVVISGAVYYTQNKFNV
jgi:hypothetical protein